MPLCRILAILVYYVTCVLFAGRGIREYLKDKSTFKKHFMQICLLLFVISFFYVLMFITDDIIEANIYRNIIFILKFFVFNYSIVFLFRFIPAVEDLNKKNSTTKLLKNIFYLLTFQVVVYTVLIFVFPLSVSSLQRIPLGWACVSFREVWIDFLLSCISMLLPYVFYTLLLKRSRGLNFKIYSILIRIFVVSVLVIGLVVDHLLPVLGVTPTPPVFIFVMAILVLSFYKYIDTHPNTCLVPNLLASDIMDAVPEGFILINSKYIVKYANQGVNDLFDFSESIIGMPIEFVFKNQFTVEEFNNDFKKIVELNTKTKSYLQITYKVKYDNWGQILGGIFLIEDITRLTVAKMGLEMAYSNIETEINTKNKQLFHANTVLQERLSGKNLLTEEYLMLASSDVLTKSINRTHFVKMLDEILESDPEPLAVFSIDIDDFKKINDSRGHWFGDIILVRVAEIIKDAGEDNFLLSRASGDDFLVIAKNIESKEMVEINVRSLLSSLSEPKVIENFEVLISASVGISLYPENGNKAEDLIKKAELANFSVREVKDKKYLFYTDELGKSVLADLDLTNEIREASLLNQFIPYYQPQVGVDVDGKQRIIGYESLARWNHPTKGILTPYHFIENAERSGAIIEISYSILKQTCLKINELENKGLNNFKISVNVSSKQLKDPNFIDIVTGIIKTTNVNVKFLELEITETSLLNYDENLISIFANLKELGISISVDDFGVAFASLNYIKILPIDKLKVDKVFIDDIGLSKKNEEVLNTIIDLSNGLNFDVVFEGVENSEQFAFITEKRKSIIQGYYFYKPMPFEEILEKEILPVSDSLLGV
ncbi:MAG: hypothetical protein CR988_01160 [Treponema sp.]|nr:MAG: hypothetical protein CR988_01160 [Treponema sp.]